MVLSLRLMVRFYDLRRMDVMVHECVTDDCRSEDVQEGRPDQCTQRQDTGAEEDADETVGHSTFAARSQGKSDACATDRSIVSHLCVKQLDE